MGNQQARMIPLPVPGRFPLPAPIPLPVPVPIPLPLPVPIPLPGRIPLPIPIPLPLFPPNLLPPILVEPPRPPPSPPRKRNRLPHPWIQIEVEVSVEVKIESRSKLLVMAFLSSSSEACRGIEPILIEFAKKYVDVDFYKLDIDMIDDAARRYGIQTTPTFVLRKDEIDVYKLVGADWEELTRKIEYHK